MENKDCWRENTLREKPWPKIEEVPQCKLARVVQGKREPDERSNLPEQSCELDLIVLVGSSGVSRLEARPECGCYRNEQ